MKLFLSVIFLSTIFVSSSAVAEKRTIIAAGITSLSPAGKGFSLALAASNARVSLQKQITLSQFTYIKDTNSTTFIKHTQGKISGTKKTSQHITKDNVTVLMKAETEFKPVYKDEICTTSTNIVSSEDDLNKLDSDLIMKTITDIMKDRKIKQGVINGLAYTRDLKIKTNRDKSLTLTSTVCAANLKY